MFGKDVMVIARVTTPRRSPRLFFSPSAPFPFPERFVSLGALGAGIVGVGSSLVQAVVNREYSRGVIARTAGHSAVICWQICVVCYSPVHADCNLHLTSRGEITVVKLVLHVHRGGQNTESQWSCVY